MYALFSVLFSHSFFLRIQHSLLLLTQLILPRSPERRGGGGGGGTVIKNLSLTSHPNYVVFLCYKILPTSITLQPTIDEFLDYCFIVHTSYTVYSSKYKSRTIIYDIMKSGITMDKPCTAPWLKDPLSFLSP